MPFLLLAIFPLIFLVLPVATTGEVVGVVLPVATPERLAASQAYRQAQIEFVRSLFSGYYRTHGRHGSWDAAVLACLRTNEELGMPWMEAHYPRYQPMVAAVEQGCDDPVVLLLAGVTQTNWGDETAYRDLVAQAWEGSRPSVLPALTRLSIARRLIDFKIRGNDAAAKKARAAAAEAVLAYPPLIEEILVNTPLAGWSTILDRLESHDRNASQVNSRLKTALAKAGDGVGDQALAALVGGFAERELLWSRLPKNGGPVTGKLVDELVVALPRIRDRLTRAWQAHPDQPDVARLMVSVAGRDQGGDAGLWLDRALAADCLDGQACKDYLEVLGGQSGATSAAVLTFARSCVEQAPKGSSIPLVLGKACAIARRLDPHGAWADDDALVNLWERLFARIAAGEVEQAPRGQTLTAWKLGAAWHCGRRSEVRRWLDEDFDHHNLPDWIGAGLVDLTLAAESPDRLDRLLPAPLTASLVRPKQVTEAWYDRTWFQAWQRLGRHGAWDAEVGPAVRDVFRRMFASAEKGMTFAEALPILERAVATGAGDYLLFMALGRCQSEAGNRQQAEASYRQALTQASAESPGIHRLNISIELVRIILATKGRDAEAEALREHFRLALASMLTDGSFKVGVDDEALADYLTWWWKWPMPMWYIDLVRSAITADTHLSDWIRALALGGCDAFVAESIHDGPGHYHDGKCRHDWAAMAIPKLAEARRLRPESPYTHGMLLHALAWGGSHGPGVRAAMDQCLAAGVATTSNWSNFAYACAPCRLEEDDGSTGYAMVAAALAHPQAEELLEPLMETINHLQSCRAGKVRPYTQPDFYPLLRRAVERTIAAGKPARAWNSLLLAAAWKANDFAEVARLAEALDGRVDESGFPRKVLKVNEATIVTDAAVAGVTVRLAANSADTTDKAAGKAPGKATKTAPPSAITRGADDF
ncbi:hypothetical protein LBMAG53_29330 [Planctomycetota bacterium]|nr:hypothetical protein LBMAG53_29330 [Planctomycetota bacterium]